MDFLKALHWRYAAKRMSGQRIPEAQLDRILEATHLAPSSYGLQRGEGDIRPIAACPNP